MFSRRLAALAAMVVLAAPGAAMAQVWSDWSEADGRSLVTAENGVVDEVLRPDDGTLEIYATFDDWLKVLIKGDECSGRGASMRCKKMAFNALFEIDDVARARQLDAELINNFVADMADGDDYVIERSVVLTGGVNLTNIRAQLDRFIGAGELVADAAWPAKGGAPAKTR
ncbi:hypothetical protein [Brevundimonas sp. FT23028]|uniref:hypothetical protein n=1 Tax=Brevundimonas sp. FT23028 TaxID=3393748 RepID=UPI003B58829B